MPRDALPISAALRLHEVGGIQSVAHSSHENASAAAKPTVTVDYRFREVCSESTKLTPPRRGTQPPRPLGINTQQPEDNCRGA
jgi:hypothetical protein